jgi:hypothetical protein
MEKTDHMRDMLSLTLPIALTNAKKGVEDPEKEMLATFRALGYEVTYKKPKELSNEHQAYVDHLKNHKSVKK